MAAINLFTAENPNGRIDVARQLRSSELAMFIYDKPTDTSDSTRFLLTYHDTGFAQPMDGGLVVTVSDFVRAS